MCEEFILASSTKFHDDLAKRGIEWNYFKEEERRFLITAGIWTREQILLFCLWCFPVGLSYWNFKMQLLTALWLEAENPPIKCMTAQIEDYPGCLQVLAWWLSSCRRPEVAAQPQGSRFQRTCTERWILFSSFAFGCWDVRVLVSF